jgi:hypothetical protein
MRLDSQILSFSGYFHLVHGFSYTRDENLPLFLPAPATFHQIHLLVHAVVRLSQDGKNVPFEADQVIRAGGLNAQTGGARVLDIFTNCGTWYDYTPVI